jgi:HAD superfamily hydrolase (TIGR01662 family)
MCPEMDAIFLDVGNTLRIVIEDAAFQADAVRKIIELTGTTDPAEVFIPRLEGRFKAYRKWAKESLLEASERELWTRYMLPDFPEEKIGPLSGKLTRLWRDHDGRRVPRADVSVVVKELVHRGYTLGIIANTITETEIPDWLEEDGLTDCFKTVVLSSKVGIRKPGSEIYLEACRRAGVDPCRSVYVGDNPSRDILGARNAGYGKVIIIVEPATLNKEPDTKALQPDHFIQECSDLLEIFPDRI